MASEPRSNPALAVLLVVLAAVFAVVAVFYAVATTSLLASADGRHYKHAILAGILAVLCLIGANFVRRSAI